MEAIQAIEWPVVEIAGRSLTFRISYSAHVQLARWGTDVSRCTVLELAAASAGTFDKKGKWHSEGYEKSLDFADLMEPSDEPKVVEAVTEALKKAYPELAVLTKPVPAIAVMPSPKPNGCASGLSEQVEADLALKPISSGA